MTEALHTGATIGILGGGQPRRLLSVAPSPLRFRTRFFAPCAHPLPAAFALVVPSSALSDHPHLHAFPASRSVLPSGF